MDGHIGLPELLIVLVTGVVPLALVVWAVVSLLRLRRTQAEILTRMASLEAAIRERGRPE